MNHHTEQSTATGLLPCPFCGQQNIYLNAPNPTIGFKGSINCPSCLASIPREVNSDEELVNCWNTRVSRPASALPSSAQAKQAILAELDDRGLLAGVDDGLHDEIATSLLSLLPADSCDVERSRSEASASDTVIEAALERHADDDLVMELIDSVIGSRSANKKLKATIPQMRETLAKIADPEFWAVDFEGSDEEVNGRKAERGDAAYELAVAALSSSPAPAEESDARGVNGCMKVAAKALRYLADHERPNGGEQNYNAAHLYQLADELDRTATPTRSAEMSAEDMREACAQAAENDIGMAHYAIVAKKRIAAAIRALPTTAVSGESNG